MHNHAPTNYQCPICLAIEGIENENTWIKPADIFYRDDLGKYRQNTENTGVRSLHFTKAKSLNNFNNKTPQFNICGVLSKKYSM